MEEDEGRMGHSIYQKESVFWYMCNDWIDISLGKQIWFFFTWCYSIHTRIKSILQCKYICKEAVTECS